MHESKRKWFFRQLEVGEYFKLLNSDELCQKISQRKYKDSLGNSHLIGCTAYGVVFFEE